jgi:hypothetical protein
MSLHTDPGSRKLIDCFVCTCTILFPGRCKSVTLALLTSPPPRIIPIRSELSSIRRIVFHFPDKALLRPSELRDECRRYQHSSRLPPLAGDTQDKVFSYFPRLHFKQISDSGGPRLFENQSLIENRKILIQVRNVCPFGCIGSHHRAMLPLNMHSEHYMFLLTLSIDSYAGTPVPEYAFQGCAIYPLLVELASLCGLRLQGICNLLSSHGLLPSRCSPAGTFHSGYVRFNLIDDTYRETRFCGRLSGELQRSSSCHTAA